MDFCSRGPVGRVRGGSTLTASPQAAAIALVGTPRCGVRERMQRLETEYASDGAARRPYQSATEHDSLRLIL
jgi:hypothetical protein